MPLDELPEEFLEAARSLARNAGPLPERVKVHYLALIAARRRSHGGLATEFTLDGLPWRSQWGVPLTLEALAAGLGERQFDDFIGQTVLIETAVRLRADEVTLDQAAARLSHALTVMESVSNGTVMRHQAASDLGIDPGDRRPGGISRAVTALAEAKVLVHMAVLDEVMVLAWAMAMGVDDPTVLMVAAGMSQADAAMEARVMGAVCPPSTMALAEKPLAGPAIEGLKLTVS